MKKGVPLVFFRRWTKTKSSYVDSVMMFYPITDHKMRCIRYKLYHSRGVTLAFWPSLLFIYVTRYNKFCIRIFFTHAEFPCILYIISAINDFSTILYREWGWYRYFGQFWTLSMHLRRSLSIRTAREYPSNIEIGSFWRFNMDLVTMTWVWNALRNATTNTYNV